MAKNTRNTEFRKIDVDQYDEEKYKEEDQTETQSPSTGPSEGEVATLLSAGRNVDALKLVLRNAPLGTKNQAVKDNACNLALRVMISIKASQIEETVKSLDRDQLDILMKYVYRGFEQPSEGNSGHLLVWHEKIYNAGGLGCIVRVLTDRKRV